jgi:hypothetical protein
MIKNKLCTIALLFVMITIVNAYSNITHFCMKNCTFSYKNYCVNDVCDLCNIVTNIIYFNEESIHAPDWIVFAYVETLCYLIGSNTLFNLCLTMTNNMQIIIDIIKKGYIQSESCIIMNYCI